jgi:hypothetical protein
MSTVSATLSQADMDAIAAAIETIQKRLPFLVDLVATERSELPKMGNKSRSFVARALEVADLNSDFLPRSFDVAEMRRDVELFEKLNRILMSLTQLQDMVDDTCMLAGSEAYTAALTVYDYAKKSAVNTNGMEPIVNEMREHFRKAPKAKVAIVQG